MVFSIYIYICNGFMNKTKALIMFNTKSTNFLPLFYSVKQQDSFVAPLVHICNKWAANNPIQAFILNAYKHVFMRRCVFVTNFQQVSQWETRENLKVIRVRIQWIYVLSHSKAKTQTLIIYLRLWEGTKPCRATSPWKQLLHRTQQKKNPVCA